MSELYYTGSLRSPDFSASLNSMPREPYNSLGLNLSYLCDGESVLLSPRQRFKLCRSAFIGARSGPKLIFQGNFAFFNIHLRGFVS